MATKDKEYSYEGRGKNPINFRTSPEEDKMLAELKAAYDADTSTIMRMALALLSTHTFGAREKK